MQRMKNIKILIGTTYLILLSVFLYFFFSKFSIQEITNYDFIKSNIVYLSNFKQSNLFFISIIFIISGIFWIVVLQGFGSPLGLIAGFLFGSYFGTIVLSITFSIGSSLTYIIAIFFFKDLIKKKIENNFHSLNKKIQKHQLFAVAILRFIGGIPIQLQNLIPVLFNIKLKNYFFGSLVGIFPQAWIVVSLGAGLEKQIKKNSEPPSFIELLSSSEIYIPILAFAILFILTLLLRNFFLKK
jgi:uncharacterized membrane protein YdjX (TVP38/TMEM64 family)